MTALAIRQVFILSAIVRSGRFLRQRGAPVPTRQEEPEFFVVLPVLREAALLGETVAHFRALAHGHPATVVVVTTARETAEAHMHGEAGDTIAAAEALAQRGECVHLHYPDPTGVKGDQLNYAAAHCAQTLPPVALNSGAFILCYDADSRPPLGSLASFASVITENPEAGVFHQSSRFELRPVHPTRPRGFGRMVCDAGALRANRFVLGFEIPRLTNCSARVSAVKRALCSGVYAHVTGHGLCVRLALLRSLPFPARSPLEDMHYSFILGSRGLPMLAVPSLDSAEVPGTVRGQVGQAARWFFGPARFTRYLRDPATRRGWRAWLMAASAFGSAAEWIGCAIVPALACVLLAVGDGPVRAATAFLVVVCGVQLVLTERWLGSPTRLSARVARLLAFPLACAVHGAGGIVDTGRLLAGGTGAGKTERGPTP
ncbi:MAG TPA: glycosyltransferase family 2 protein [Streptosporangiaceae bacterium]|nr:glycosyltransferase family 2 protein [Streptosporangiaceae bacterium]